MDKLNLKALILNCLILYLLSRYRNIVIFVKGALFFIVPCVVFY